MSGLKIRTVAGIEFEICGPVSYNPEYDTYYCTGQSWPAEIVVEVIGG